MESPHPGPASPEPLTAPADVSPAADLSDLADWAKAMSHPARLHILRILAGTAGCFCGDIVDRLPLAQATVSQHLKELKRAGLITGEIEGPRTCYCLQDDAVRKTGAAFAAFFAALHHTSREDLS